MNVWYLRLLNLVVWLCYKAFDIPRYHSVETVVTFTTRFGGISIKGDIEMGELREGQSIDVTAELTTRSGNPAAYEVGSVSWEFSDPSIADVQQDPENELKCKVVGIDGSTNGTGTLTFRADGDPDADEVRPIIGTLDIVVTQGEAFVVSLSASDPVDDIPVEPTPEPEPEPIPEPEPEPEPTPEP